MTHDELLAKINKPQMYTIVYEGLESYVEILALMASRNALRAVVELHKPDETTPPACRHCDGISNEYSYSINYPCQTIQAIERELG